MTSNNLMIVKADEGHSGQLWELFQEHFQYDTSEVSPLNEFMIRSSIALNDLKAFLAKDTARDEFVGSLLFVNTFSVFVGKIVWMDQLYVKPSHRGQKVALRLVKAVSSVAKDYDSVLRWECLTTNVDAIQFHHSFGGEVIYVTHFKKENFDVLGFELDREGIKKLLAKDEEAKTDTIN